MSIQKSSLYSTNGSLQTFTKDGFHIATEGIIEYILLESASIPINTTRVFRLRDRLLTIQPSIIWFTPSVTNQSFNFIIRQDVTSLYSLIVPTSASYLVLPQMLLKPSQDILLATPSALSLTNVYILAREVAYSEIINGV